jgi:hypothetical protein
MRRKVALDKSRNQLALDLLRNLGIRVIKRNCEGQCIAPPRRGFFDEQAAEEYCTWPVCRQTVELASVSLPGRITGHSDVALSGLAGSHGQRFSDRRF